MKPHSLPWVVLATSACLFAGCSSDGIPVLPTQEATWIGTESQGQGPEAEPFEVLAQVFLPIPFIFTFLDLETSGLEPILIQPTAENPVLVGTINHITKGTDPQPRDNRLSHYYLGLVRFDLEDPFIQAQMEPGLEKATLIVEMFPASYTRPNTPIDSSAYQGITMEPFKIRLPHRPWSAGTRYDSLRGSDILPFTSSRNEIFRYHPPIFSQRKSTLEVDVTSQVQSWLDDSSTNNGFAFLPDIMYIGWNNDRQLHSYHTMLRLKAVEN